MPKEKEMDSSTIFSPSSHARYAEEIKRAEEAASIRLSLATTQEHADDASSLGYPGFESAPGIHSYAGVDGIAPPSSTSSLRTQRRHIIALWVALSIAIFLLLGLTGFQIYQNWDKSTESKAATRGAEVQRLESAAKANMEVVRLTQELKDKNATVTSLQADVMKLQTSQATLTEEIKKLESDQILAATKADERFITACSNMLQDTLQGQPAAFHTTYVCQSQEIWSLSCEGAVVSQALLGRFTSAPTGPCTDKGNALAQAVCLNTVDLTPQVKAALAEANGKPVVDMSPAELFQKAKVIDPCPRTYKQLSIVYTCPVPDPPEHEQKCRKVLQDQKAAVQPVQVQQIKIGSP